MAEKFKNPALSDRQLYDMDIKRVASYIWARKWLILVVAAIFAVIGMRFSGLLIKPVYDAQSSLVLTTQKTYVNSDGSTYTYTELYYSSDTVTYQYLVLSDYSLNYIKSALGDDTTLDDLRKAITLTVVTDTSVFNINVTSDDPNFSYNVCKAVIDVFPQVMQNINPSISINVIVAPVFPDKPSNSQSGFMLAAKSAVVGACLAILVLLLIEAFSNTVLSVKDIRKNLDISILGTIPTSGGKLYSAVSPRSSRKNKNRYSSNLVFLPRANFSLVESYKSVRTKIEALSAKRALKTILVASTVACEGKTTVAVNLSYTLAKNGHSVLLVDCDLRKPAVHVAFGMDPRPGRGLVNYLSGGCNISQIFGYIKELGINVVLSGGTADNASELIAGEDMSKFLNAVYSRFDYIIIDSPPAHLVTDAVVLSSLVDGVLLVVGENRATVDAIRENIENLDESGKLIGCVYNGATSTGPASKYGRYNKYYGAITHDK